MKPLIVGNWKLNGDAELLDAMSEELGADECACAELVICPPSVLLSQRVGLNRIHLGAQGCSEFESGAHTGEISAKMLRQAGAEFVIVGHSERRANNGEQPLDCAKKAAAAQAAGLKPIYCIGESGSERYNGQTEDALTGLLKPLLEVQISCHGIIVAYEPVWAIGTGSIPMPTEIEATMTWIRSWFANRVGEQFASRIRLLYGGSVTAANARAILGLNNVDGVLVGGASLVPSTFAQIAIAAGQARETESELSRSR